MKQPIALDVEVIKYIIDNWEDNEVNFDGRHMAKLLKNLHFVYIDNFRGKSNWLSQVRALFRETENQNLRKTLLDILGPRTLQYVPVSIEDNADLIKKIAEKTPDSIGIRNKSDIVNDVMFYSTGAFVSDQYHSKCRLYRPRKTIALDPDEVFSPSEILAPYLRDSTTLEFFDKFLFLPGKSTVNSDLFESLISLCKKLTSFTIYTGHKSNPKIQKDIVNKIKHLVSEKTFKGIVPYKSNKNHDRFIILNENEITIRFTNSFNNLEKLDSDRYKVLKEFEISIREGRRYFG